MQLHREICAVGHPIALAIGNFDGVHLGHQAILDNARNAASRLGFQPAALTFSPLPREYFARLQHDAARASVLIPARLMSVTEKLAALDRHGMAHVFMPRFNAAFAALSPLEFLHQLRAANVRWLMVGEDFRFGEKRAGDVTMLRQFAHEHGITVETMADIANSGGTRISSSSIRDALRQGKLDDAATMLGQRYAITGRVTHGKKLGRTLGFPTANVSLTGRVSGKNAALHGVFAVQCCLTTRGLEGVAGECGDTLNGVANLGSNPVVSPVSTADNRLHLEVFLFDNVGDIYGKRLKVTFIEKIRDELKLASLDALVTQMHDDAAKAKTILSRISDDGKYSRHTEKRLQDHP
jgi:riboflavin kinase / FMN adenylyltransferase